MVLSGAAPPHPLFRASWCITRLLPTGGSRLTRPAPPFPRLLAYHG